MTSHLHIFSNDTIQYFQILITGRVTKSTLGLPGPEGSCPSHMILTQMSFPPRARSSAQCRRRTLPGSRATPASFSSVTFPSSGSLSPESSPRLCQLLPRLPVTEPRGFPHHQLAQPLLWRTLYSPHQLLFLPPLDLQRKSAVSVSFLSFHNQPYRGSHDS